VGKGFEEMIFQFTPENENPLPYKEAKMRVRDG
jgi:hypothetical protein